MNNVNMTKMLEQIQAMKVQAQGGAEGPKAADGKVEFGELLKKSIDAVNETKVEAGRLQAAFERGDSNVDLAEVMIAIQKSRISFQTMTQVRNKLLDAYQDIKNMPI